MSKKKGKKKNEESTKIYARVRGLMPWEPKKVSLAVEGSSKVRNKSGKITNEYDFARVFKPQATNEDVFKVCVIPLISNVLKGFNAVMIAYGQTGAGKTFSMLGKPKLGVVGLLPRMLAYMVDTPSVTKVELSAVEAFGHHVAKIELFDLFDEINQTQVWNDKHGNTSLDMHKARRVPISDADDAHEKIIYAHHGSHFAPTGKNPESSRGHVTFVAKIHQKISKHESKVSYFVMVDCAGSEGETAFTDEFKARIDRDTLMARRLEAGTINTGLSELQVIFNQLRTKGELTKSIGNGLRRVLHPYINTNTYLSVLFALSPAINNSKATESTLKFAVTAGMVKVAPVASRGKTNWANLSKELKAHLEKQEKIIEANNDQIEDVERQMARIREQINRAKRGLPAKKLSKKKKKKKGGGGMKISVDGVEEDDDDDEYESDEDHPLGVEFSPRSAPAQAAHDFSSAVDGSLMDDLKIDESALNDEADDAIQIMGELDDSIMDLMAELDDNYKKDFEEEKERIVQKKKERAQAKSSQARSKGQAGQNARHRTMTAAENDAAMAHAQMSWQEQQKLTPLRPVKKAVQKKSREQEIEKRLKEQEEVYSELQKTHEKLADPGKSEQMDEEELQAHAMDLNILLAEQEAITKGMEQSKQIIVDYLKADGRQALIQWLRIKKLID